MCKWEAKGWGRGGRVGRGQGATLLRVCPRRRGPRCKRGVSSGQSDLIKELQVLRSKNLKA